MYISWKYLLSYSEYKLPPTITLVVQPLMESLTICTVSIKEMLQLYDVCVQQILK